MSGHQEVKAGLSWFHRLEQKLELKTIFSMVETLFGRVDDEELVNKISVVSWNVLKFEIVEIVLLKVFNSVERYLNVFRSCSSALSDQVSDGLALIYFSDALDWESPEYLFADHHQDLAFVHPAGVGNEREGDL